jgi:hypothetical protein
MIPRNQDRRAFVWLCLVATCCLIAQRGLFLPAALAQEPQESQEVETSPETPEPLEPREGANQYGLFEPVSPNHYVPVTEPTFAAPSSSGLDDQQWVIGVCLNGDARCYPLRQMIYHHVVNDRVGGQRVAITYCGMANTAVVFDLEEDADNLQAAGMFGGMLALRRVEDGAKVWAQIAPVPIPNNPADEKLQPAPCPVIVRFGLWRALHPRTKVLRPVAKFQDYYEAYDRRREAVRANPMVNRTILGFDERLDPEVEVFGVARDGEAKAYLLDWLKEKGRLSDQIAGRDFTIIWDPALDAPRVEEADFDGLWLRSRWYAWGNFYPGTALVGKEKQNVTP